MSVQVVITLQCDTCPRHLCISEVPGAQIPSGFFVARGAGRNNGWTVSEAGKDVCWQCQKRDVDEDNTPEEQGK